MSEVKRTYYESGKLKTEVFLINGKKNGEEKLYYENGQLEEICSYIDDKMHGEYKTYYENGCGLSSDNSKRKNLSSTDSFGQLCEIFICINGKRNGVYVY